MIRCLFAFLFLVACASLHAATPPTLPKLDFEEMKDPKKAAAAAMELEETYPAKKRPEAIKMLVAILRGSQLNGTDGWFGPAVNRFSFPWLAEFCKADPKKGIKRADFPGDDLGFARLDRNRDGVITGNDLDWSNNNPWVQQAGLVSRIFRQMNASGDGHLTKEEMQAFFDKVAKDKDHVNSDDLKEIVLAGVGGSFSPGDTPKIETLLKGLYTGEIGSIHEGPGLGDAASDFELSSPVGKTKVQLKNHLGKKPVVLILGNFTCGPFRALYSDIENVVSRYRDKAEFVMVYVREAHPTDGWVMESNAKVGVKVAQPTSNEERAKVCEQFRTKLKPTIPVVVDTIEDRVGNAYSGMPGRLYVINADGKITYKSGRGPFGFRAGEMEQALAMTILEATPVKAKKPVIK